MAKEKVKKRLDDNLLVDVASRVKGSLSYTSPKSGISYRFDDYGSEQSIELGDLRRMLSSQKKFFTKGWIEILDDEIIDYLNLERFQKNIVDEEDIEILFESTPEEIISYLQGANTNVKKIVFGFARDKYVNGELTNIHTIEAIEECLKPHKINPNS